MRGEKMGKVLFNQLLEEPKEKKFKNSMELSRQVLEWMSLRLISIKSMIRS
jgi:hypothetical protein